jgi:hypothetical protein
MLDGLFIGGLCSIALWIIHATVQQLAIRVTQWRLAKDSAPHGSAAVITATIFSLSLAGLAWGQTGPTAPAATATVTAQEQLPRTEPMSASPAKAVSFDSKPLTIYIPYDPKNGDPRESRFVYLPYDEFQELWKLANPDKPVDVGPGVTSTIAEVGYEGRLDGDVARFDGRIVLYTFRDEWTRVALPLASVALEKVELDGQPATLEERTDEKPEVIKPASPGNPGSPANADSRAADTAGRLSIYVEKAGMHVVDIRFSVPVTRFGATGRLTIPFRSAAAGKLRFELPAPELDLHIEGATGGWRIEKQLDQVESNVGQSSSTSDADNDDDVIHQSGQHGESLTVGVDLIKSQEAKEAREWLVLPVGGAAEVVVRWQPRRGELSETRLVSADQTVLVDIQDSGVHLRSQVHYRIAQGSLRKLELRVPRGVAIRSVVGADIADWSVVRDLPAEDAESSGEGRLEIALKTDVRTGTDIEIGAYLVGQQPSGLVAVQTLEPLGMSRETGRIVIGCTAQFHVRIGETSNIVQIERDGVQLPGGSDEACGLLAAYRYTGRPWSMQIVIDRLRSRVNSTARTAVHVTRERITVHAILEAVVSDAPIASLRLQLPQGMRINRVNLPAGSDWYIDRTGQALQLLVELAQPVSGKIPVELIGTLPLDANATELQVPFVALLEASDEAGQIAVAFDQDIEAFGADFGGTRPIPPSELTGSLQQFAKASRVFAFQYDRTPEGLSLGLRSAGSQLSADVLSTVSVREGSVSYLSEINFEIRGTARSRLQFVTPPILGADIELQGNGIRQTQSESDSSGFRTWTVHFQQPIRGGYAIRLLQSLPVPADGTIRAAIIQPVEADPVRSYIILENRAATQLTEAETRGVSSLAASDVPLPLTDELRRRAISAHKVLDHQASLTWLRHEREQEKAIAAHANLADLVTVIHRDGTYRTQAAYVITNRTRQFLEIALPPNSELWAVHVAGQPVRPATVKRANRDVTLVPLQRVSAGDISIQVVLVYAGSLGGKIGRWTKITPPAPEMLGNVPVARTLWTVYTPEEFSTAIVDADSNMTPVAAGDLIVARDLAFFEELNELIKVCKFSSSENANRLACNNLKQLGAALSAFQRPAAPLSIGALDNRQGWREADSNTLSAQIENFYCPSDRADGAVRLGELKGKDTWAIVQQRARELQTEIHAIVTKDQAGTQEGQVGIQLQSQLDDYFSKSKSDGAEKATDRKPSGAELFSLQQENVNADERESRRYKMREQNWANVEKLKEQQDQTRALQTPEQAVDGLAQNARPSGARAPVGAGLGGMASGSKPSFRPAASIPQTPGGGAGGGAGTQLIGGDATTRAGIQSIGIEIPRVGKPQHFMRILGDPKLVVSARHQDLGRWSGRLVWAALCLGFAAFLLIALSQSRVWAFIYAQWPWFAAATGVAWLFLLPLGLGGLLLAVPAIAVLAWRTRARTATAN